MEKWGITFFGSINEMHHKYHALEIVTLWGNTRRNFHGWWLWKCALISLSACSKSAYLVSLMLFFGILDSNKMISEWPLVGSTARGVLLMSKGGILWLGNSKNMKPNCMLQKDKQLFTSHTVSKFQRCFYAQVSQYNVAEICYFVFPLACIFW